MTLLFAAIYWVGGELRVGMPEHIGSARQLSGAEDDRAETVATTFEDTVHAPADAAMYQTTDGTRFMVFAAAVDSVWATTVLHEMAAGVQDGGGSVALIQESSFEEAGASFACAPMTAPLTMPLCVWADGETIGAVFGEGLAMERAEKLVVDAQDAVDD